MDLVGPKNLGLATGINEFAGYSGVAVSVLVTGYLAAVYGLRPAPFYFGLAIILAALGVALVLAKETVHHAHWETSQQGSPGSASSGAINPSFLAVFKLTTWQDRALFSASQAGLVHKFTDALVWVSFPLFFKSRGLDIGQIGLIIGAYGLTVRRDHNTGFLGSRRTVSHWAFDPRKSWFSAIVEP